MSKKRLIDDYFNWMCNLVCNNKRYKGQSYLQLLRYLHSVDYIYILPMDANRAGDGIDLRYRFGFSNQLDSNIISEHLGAEECSVFEMMLGLCVRCEEQIMDNPDIGNRTGQWFWSMIESLGLLSMTDDNFDEDMCESVIEGFLFRTYKPNGSGGLFTLHHCAYDMRNVEVWYQAMWYLNEEIEKEGGA